MRIMIKPKVGVVSCSGECCSLGTLSRIATRRVLEDLKAGETVTICLPLFLAGDSGERMFAKQVTFLDDDGTRLAEILAERITVKVDEFGDEDHD